MTFKKDWVLSRRRIISTATPPITRTAPPRGSTRTREVERAIDRAGTVGETARLVVGVPSAAPAVAVVADVTTSVADVTSDGEVVVAALTAVVADAVAVAGEADVVGGDGVGVEVELPAAAMVTSTVLATPSKVSAMWCRPGCVTVAVRR